MRQGIVVAALVGIMSLGTAAVTGFHEFVAAPAAKAEPASAAPVRRVAQVVVPAETPFSAAPVAGRGDRDEVMTILNWFSAAARDKRVLPSGGAGRFVAKVPGGARPVVAFAAGIGIAPATARPDFGAALKWYALAADKGDGEARYQVGVAYRDGVGVAADRTLALRFFREAAETGNPHAALALGELYAANAGEMPDALRWLDRAVARCAPLPVCEKAEAARGRLVAQMTPEQIAAARLPEAVPAPAVAGLTVIGG